jgi:hypothetical protein
MIQGGAGESRGDLGLRPAIHVVERVASRVHEGKIAAVAIPNVARELHTVLNSRVELRRIDSEEPARDHRDLLLEIELRSERVADAVVVLHLNGSFRHHTKNRKIRTNGN